MEQAEVEQICEADLASLIADHGKEQNSAAIQACVERVYQRIRRRAADENKVLIGVNQTITTESLQVGIYKHVLYIITLVGTVVDAEVLKQQQRLQQFDPRAARPH